MDSVASLLAALSALDYISSDGEKFAFTDFSGTFLLSAIANRIAAEEMSDVTGNRLRDSIRQWVGTIHAGGDLLIAG